VIVIDEAQAIPVEVLDPVVDGLRVLCDRFGASVLIMTATQPTLEHIGSTQGRRAHDLLPEVGDWARVFERTTTKMIKVDLSHGEVARLVSEHRQCLCIVNTINDAREITTASGAAVLHLSTMLRPADRRDRLKEIQRRLRAGEACRVVSTQLVEAGIDLDFPVVMRAMAPLPSLAQADGRCNRNGSLAGGGLTIVFNLVGGKQPPGAYYRAGTAHTSVMLRDPAIDFRHPATVASWYEGFLQDPLVVEALHKGDVQRSRAALDYRSTADQFHMIDDDTQPVVVPWERGHSRAAAITTLLSLLRDGKRLDADAVRKLQDVTVSLRRSAADRAIRLKSASPLNDYLLEWTGRYDDQIGLVFESPAMEVMIL
jgi:CRISPR-associated endonuclease/helicase Cas3